MTCTRPGCSEPCRKPTHRYCGRRCAALVNAKLKPVGFFQRLGHLGRAAQRARGRGIVRQADVLLMAAGRYEAAARALYDRGYNSGWIAGRKGQSQLPDVRQRQRVTREAT